MKKILISTASILLLVFSSCYDDSKNATVRINLGNIPVAKSIENKSLFDKVFSIFYKDAYAQTTIASYNIDILHVAVYSADKVVEKVSINASDVIVDGNYNSYVELTVPSGSDMAVLVVGEYNSDGVYANYIGFKRTALSAGENYVNVEMKSSSVWASELNLASVSDSGTITWNSIGFPADYRIKDQSGNVVYEGSGDHADFISGGCNGLPFEFYLDFKIFGISSDYNIDSVLVYDSNQC